MTNETKLAGEEGSTPEGAANPSAPERVAQARPPQLRVPKRDAVIVVKRAGPAVSTRASVAPSRPPVEVRPVADEASVEPSSPVPSEVHPVTPTAAVQPAAAPPDDAAPAVPSASVADEVKETESFAEMFDKQVKSGGVATRRSMPKVGDKVRAKIFQLGAERAFVLVGKYEAMIELDELKDDAGILRSGVGDEVEAHVIETGAHGILLSRKLSAGAVSLSILSDARASGMPVEGIVVAVNKGGLEVAVGKLRAFCPASQVGLYPVRLDEYVGHRLMFAVTKVKDSSVSLSRRALLEVEQRAKAADLRKTLEVGKVLRGTVVNVQAFGAFVDLGGIEGLLPVSELAHQRVGHAGEVVKVGDEVEVELLRIEAPVPHSPDKSKRKERVTLSMRKLLPDPFEAASASIQEGSIIKGKVVRLQPFGAFVELLPGVDGLIHISALSQRRIAHPRDVVTVGEDIEVKVEAVDAAEKRIRLRLVKDGVAVGETRPTAEVSEGARVASTAQVAAVAKPQRPRRGQVVTGKVNRIEPFGVFIEWGEATGLIPAAETGTERGTDLKRVFAIGKEIKAEIIEVNGDKVKLSMTAAQRSEERAELAAWKSEQSQQVRGGFNSLADKLKGLKLKA